MDLDVGGVAAKVAAGRIEVGVAGATVGLDLGDEIRTSRPFVAELRQRLSFHLKPLYDEVAEFLRDLLPDDQAAGSVLVVDGLEKLRGTTDDDTAVQRSIEALFVNHADDARLFVPVPHVRSRTGGGQDASATHNISELREVVSRRIPIGRIFADPDLVDAVILASGGHLRDVFRILQRLMNLTLRLGLRLPLPAQFVDEAIGLHGLDFAAMTAEQATFLRRVAAGDGTVQPP